MHTLSTNPLGPFPTSMQAERLHTSDKLTSKNIAMIAPISNPVLISQAELLATELGLTDFTASIGWVEHWKRRHGIAPRTVSEEAAVDHTV